MKYILQLKESFLAGIIEANIYAVSENLFISVKSK